MQTRISLFCDKLIEAGWLAALIVAPLFFNVYSSRVFEPDKISLVRSLALVMTAAWVVRQLETRRGRGTQPPVPLRERLRAIARENPFVLPASAMVVAYVISTIFSVAPTVSLWGSYQRMQGTYTTFSYIAIFLIAAGSLRSRAQVDRAINTVLVVSFPIAFYGILQHFRLDPLPWGGETSLRVASNMGNSIFVAAYLIMIVPLALARWIESLARLTGGMLPRRRAVAIGIAALLLVALIGVWFFDFTLGVALAVVLMGLVPFAGRAVGLRIRDVLLASTYGVLLAAQLLSIVYSQSRGPELGLGVGLFAFLVLGTLVTMHYMPQVWRRAALGGVIALASVAIIFLLVFNMPASPLEGLKDVPYIGRLGQILDRNSPTAQVRELIWEGALKLYLPHAPLWSPTTGDDPLNALRPLVGYGPEAMYVAFNPFYPADLAHLEARNASPDRAHNETFDALVMTGAIGFAAYLFLFISVFYFGLKWLGVITSPAQRNAFIALWFAGGVLVAVVFGLWNGWHWVGVALPFGMIIGFLIFLMADAVRRYRSETPLDLRRSLWLCALIAALVAHFVEIHFGIAIVSTRTYFYFYIALLVILGTDRLSRPALAATPAPAAAAPEVMTPPRVAVRPERTRAGDAASRRKRRRQAEADRTTARRTGDGEMPLAPVLAWTAITTMIVLTLAYEFVNNQAGVPSALDAVLRSLFYKGDAQSWGIFLMLALTWVMAGIVGFAEGRDDIPALRSGLGISLALFAVLSFTAFVWYILFQMRWLTQPGDLTDAFISTLGLYYIALLVLLVAFAVILVLDRLPQGLPLLRSATNAAVGPVLVLVVLGLVYLTNYTSVSADILYKAGDNNDKLGDYTRSMDNYQRALVLQPGQDFYALFLGRAYLEAARNATDPNQRAQMLAKSEQVLLNAQYINPLNTDHSANLARLQRIWAALVDDPAQKRLHYQKSSEYYAQATRLSPNTAYLYNEWSQTYLQSGDLENMRAKLEQSLKIDDQYAQTYTYLGDYYRLKSPPDAKSAADYYLKALARDPEALSDTDHTPLPGPMSILAMPDYAPAAIKAYQELSTGASLAPYFALAELYKRTGQPDKVRQQYDKAVQVSPGDITARLALVNYYSEAGQIDAAVTAMKGLMENSSPRSADYTRFQDFYTQLQNLQKAIQAAKNAPNDPAPHRSLAAIWKARQQPQFALPEYQTVARLAPGDYDALKNIAFALLALNRVDDAQAALVSAAALAPDGEKPVWQNLQAALNAQKAQQTDVAVKQAQAALALTPDVDKPSIQAYLTVLQGGN